MLKSTMGCPDTFEMRRRELAELGILSGGGRASHGGAVSDEAVVQSFLGMFAVCMIICMNKHVILA
jgi:hypothetical protein